MPTVKKWDTEDLSYFAVRGFHATSTYGKHASYVSRKKTISSIVCCESSRSAEMVVRAKPFVYITCAREEKKIDYAVNILSFHHHTCSTILANRLTISPFNCNVKIVSWSERFNAPVPRRESPVARYTRKLHINAYANAFAFDPIFAVHILMNGARS